MTTANCVVGVEAPSRERLVETFASRSKHLTWAQFRKRFDDLLQHGYADARPGFDGTWRFVLIGKRTRQ